MCACTYVCMYVTGSETGPVKSILSAWPQSLVAIATYLDICNFNTQKVMNLAAVVAPHNICQRKFEVLVALTDT